MWKITWTKKEDLDDVLTMLMAVNATDRLEKLDRIITKKGHTYSDDTTIKNKIKNKVK